MSAPAQAQSQQQQVSTPTGQSGAPLTGPPPVPPTKPVLSSPGAYMANFTSSTTQPTAGIHSVNKSHEKPAIAARPIPPPTLPKYSSSFSKVDRDRNEFTTGSKIDRAEREKVCIDWTKFFISLTLSIYESLVNGAALSFCVSLSLSQPMNQFVHFVCSVKVLNLNVYISLCKCPCASVHIGFFLFI